jgi:hypothetical protein
MLLSHKHRFVMMEPWKTASQTIRHRLSGYDESPYPGFFYFSHFLNRVVHQHITCAEFACFPEARLGYWKAAFIRNPYDRVYSGFGQLQRDIKNQPAAQYPEPWIRDLVRKQLAENFAQLCRAGFEFDEWVALIEDDQIFEVGRNSNFPLHPAHYWTHIEGAKAVDFIGRVETFETDFRSFLVQTGIPQPEQINANVIDLKGDADTDSKGYRYVKRMNTRSRARINALFEKDFELFGYARVD